jgi:PAS domain S-box-containing protein
MMLDEISHGAELVLKVSSLIGGGVGAGAWLVPRMVRGYRRVKDLAARLDAGLEKADAVDVKALATAIAKVDLIEQTLGPNGGKSLYDKLSRLERTVKVRDARSAAMLLASPVPTWEADASGQFVQINRAFEDLAMATPAEVLGLEWIALLHAACRDRVVREWDHAVADRRRFSAEATIMADGQPLDILLSADPMRTIDGEVVGWLGRARPL